MWNSIGEALDESSATLHDANVPRPAAAPALCISYAGEVPAFNSFSTFYPKSWGSVRLLILDGQLDALLIVQHLIALEQQGLDDGDKKIMD